MDRAGSSPLTRGKPPPWLQSPQGGRLIPAHAGKTGRGAGASPPPRAHPRSRGENFTVPDLRGRFLGSSPLTRGKPSGNLPGSARCGLIPAHAGKTIVPDWAARHTAAHPRSRGENAPTRPPRARGSGSSPLTRGKPYEQMLGTAKVGLIPAHAGKTAGDQHVGAGLRAHPRSRGENTWSRMARISSTGSSPLTRGKRGFQVGRHAPQGLIPAHAGKTNGLAPSPGRGRAHPRSRGENTERTKSTLGLTGSSPLTRGKHDAESVELRESRLIPAHAGKTG